MYTTVFRALRRSRLSLAFALVQLYLAAVDGQAPQPSPIAFDRASWIVSTTGSPRDSGIFHFRRQVQLASVPDHLKIRVSADSRFILYVNGVYAAEGPAHSDPEHWKYETVDLAPLLHPGANTVAAVVWNFGISSPVATVSVRTAFLLEAEDPAYKDLDTNSSWEVEPASGRSTITLDYSKVLHDYYAAAPGERIDGTLYDWNFATTGTNAKGQHAQVLGVPTVDGVENGVLYWRLQPDALPALEHSPTPFGSIVRSDLAETSKTIPFTIPAHTHAHILFDRGVLTTAYPNFTFSGGSGATVRATYAEALVDQQGKKGNRNDIANRHILGIYDEFLLDGNKERTYAPLDWRTWRYLELDVTTSENPMRLDSASATFTAYPFHLAATFQSHDPALDQIWTTSWRTARLDAHDTYMDTPYWERLQYVGDTRLQALISYSLAGDDRLARQAIETLDNSRLSSGLTQSRYPSNLAQIIPPFSLLWIGMLHDFWMYRNDPAFVRAHLPGVEATLTWFLDHRRDDGLLTRLPWWAFADWSSGFDAGVPPQEANGGSATLTLQFIEALRNAAELETALGRKENASLYLQASDHAATTLRSKCWSAQLGLLADTPAQTHYSQQANAMAVWLGVVPPAQSKHVMQTLLAFDSPDFAQHHPELSISTASYYFRFYLARALETVGLGDQYLDTLGPWKDMLALGLSTWAEQPEPTRSDSHAWSAHPAFDLLRIVAGIRPAAPNFARVMIEPHPGKLASFTAMYPHPAGNILVGYAEGKFDITLPPRLSGTLKWNNKTYALHPGRQTLPRPKKTSATDQ